jgi:hypothetical protein
MPLLGVEAMMRVGAAGTGNKLKSARGEEGVLPITPVVTYYPNFD